MARVPLNRTRFAGEINQTPYVCLLDVNRRHPLLTPALAASDLHTVEPEPTMMTATGRKAGVALRDLDG